MLPDFFFWGDYMNSRIKLSARNALCGSYAEILPAVTAIILLRITFSAINAALNSFTANISPLLLCMAALFSLLAAVTAISPLRLKLQIKHLFLAQGKSSFCKPQFGFSDVAKACDLCIRLFFIKIFMLAVFETVPCFVSMIYLYCNSRSPVSLNVAYAVWAGTFFLATAGLIFWAIFIQRYSKALFYLACYKDFSPDDAIRESVRKTQGKAAETFLFKASFLPWLILCIGILPALYVLPYYKQSVTCFYLSR